MGSATPNSKPVQFLLNFIPLNSLAVLLSFFLQFQSKPNQKNTGQQGRKNGFHAIAKSLSVHQRKHRKDDFKTQHDHAAYKNKDSVKLLIHFYSS